MRNSERFCWFQLVGLLCLVLAGSLGLAGQTQANLYKEVVDRKARIVWRNAPQNALPTDVCELLQSCAGAPDKVIALPPVTEAGKRVARGLFLSRSNSAARADMVILAHQTPTDAYFFAVAPDGTLQRAAYGTRGKPWIQIATSLARPVFDKDKQIWLAHVAKLGATGAPASSAAAAASAS